MIFQMRALDTAVNDDRMITSDDLMRMRDWSVYATALPPRNAPRKFAIDAMTTAWYGVAALQPISVATVELASWRPLVIAKMIAVMMANATITSDVKRPTKSKDIESIISL
jgi:hypothetical protein